MQIGKAMVAFAGFLLAPLVSVQVVCAQPKEDRLLNELATRIVLTASLEKLSSSAGDVVSVPMNVPLQLKLARALLLIRGSDNAELLKSRISRLRVGTSIAARLARSSEYVEAALKKACDAIVDDSLQVALQDQELRMNEQVTPELSREIVRIAMALEPEIAKELTAAINDVNSQLRQANARKPGILACAGEKPPPRRLQDSRARVLELLNQALTKRP